MKPKELFASMRIIPKLVLTFLLVLIPLYAIGLLMNESGSRNIKQEIASSLSSRSNLYMEIVDNDLYRVHQLLRQYVNDEDLQNLSVKAEIMSDFERTQAALRLKRRLDLLKQSSGFVANVTAMIPLMNRSLSSNDNSILELDRPQFEALRQPPSRLVSPFMMWDDRLFMSMPYPEGTNRPPVFLLLIEISKPELQAALAQFTNEGGEALLAGMNGDWSIASEAGSPDGPPTMAGLGQVQFDRNGETQYLSVSNTSYMAVRQQSERFGMTLTMLVPTEKINAPVTTYRKWMLALSAASIAIVLFFSFSIYQIIHRPLRSLMHSFRRIEQGQLNQTVEYPFKDEFGYLYDRFNSMVKQLNVLVHEVYEQQYRAKLSELRHLQSQINPHFLYNTYFILYRMAKREDTENVVRLTKHLGEYFQYITRDGSDEVPLEKEAHHARTYTDIQTIRFGHRIETRFDDVPPEAVQLGVPRLILQPIIENAYHHALEKKTKEGWLHVSFAYSPQRVVISVEDNGDDWTAEKLESLRLTLRADDGHGERTGMINVHRRLRIKYGEQAGISLALGERGGLRVDIEIPIEEASE
ncbi:two-component system sensor histidine kinase YesM [Paenibacillus phyllosphaerae]|uniref:Two-component system sensor histidine kinase YesM n=1 Tax=Paenibacillus phyllosphaerae TaxID=274593 RepID=A0A7W5B500_9BACL|nr:sensor histidine kinase [Paenibacillus phyllosphaerae]MBB3114498.1 two-component system sensor histidine kinase YesM [Paenibacillus phyllosphaerae]